MNDRMLVSVTRPVDPAAVGTVDAHNHLWIAPVPDAAPDSPVLTDFDLLLVELKEFAAAANGLAAQFDCQPSGFGRDAVKLRELSEQSGVVIVCATGYHLRKYAPSHWLWTASVERAADHFIRELTEGVEEVQSDATIRAGFIKIAFEDDPAEMPPALLDAVGAAVGATGCGVEVHTEQGKAAEHILPLLEAHGVPAERVVLCHMDKRKDLGLHRELIGAGALLEYDTFTRTEKYPEPYPFLAQIIAAGLSHGIALATDMARTEQWSKYGGVAFPRLLDAPELRSVEDALSGEVRAGLIGGNIVRRLARYS
jgi:predicted metal-dependent phosphotriesterase family hydrolase